MTQLMSTGDHYSRDHRLGAVCEFNGVDVYAKYNADVYSFEPSDGELSTDYALKTSGSGFNLWHSKFGSFKLEIGFYVGGQDKRDLKQNVNKLIVAAKQCIIRYGDDFGFEFDCVLESYEVEFTDIEWYDDVVLTFAAVRRDKIDVTETSGTTTSVKFFNEGSKESGLKITALSASTISNFKFMYLIDGEWEEVKIDQLKANLPFTLDGIEGKVQENGINAYNRSNLINFPKAYPGDNQVKFSSAVKAAVEFYPTYEI